MAEGKRVDFYILQAAEDETARMRFACRLAEKAYLLDNTVHIHTATQADAARLDDLLWTFRKDSFLPHELLRDGHPPASPVTIGFSAQQPPEAGLLINLATDIPPFADDFPRIAEIIDGSEAAKSDGRIRYRTYQRAGRAPVIHQLEISP